MTISKRRFTAARAFVLAQELTTRRDEGLIHAVHQATPKPRIAVVTSFGTEAAVLLDMVARVDRGLPVYFVDTGKLFAETLTYRDLLIDRLRLTNVHTIKAVPHSVTVADPTGSLHRTDPDACCHVRKVLPYRYALQHVDIEITGRKRHHGAARSDLAVVERDRRRLKLNPLADWSQADIADAFIQRGLPPHPLSDQGYSSVGCAACTQKPGASESPRAGRWQGTQKTECGIHFAFTPNKTIAAEKEAAR